MNREQFLNTLKHELRVMDAQECKEILADYEEYFRDALAAGRTEEDVARSLGAPRQLARELRAEARIKDWEESRSPGSFARMFVAVVGLGLVNLMLLIPLLLVAGLLLGFFAGGLSMVVAGVGLVAASVPGSGLTQFITVDLGGIELTQPLSMGLSGIGVFCVGLVWVAIDVWLTKWLAIGVARYARLNYRVVRGEF
ncbi:DUF1700 domain-containing protein [Chitinimonas sp. BJYL2]|uniref:DUF1700 domain-containing protein n=1 Tax=Chitinimonas sp. BJYL2 TaxID=2976696 RepID=UPI0022B428CE|nr:DUF1700 domain-containing protein [Chitinimonas sp. BJYL2]